MTTTGTLLLGLILGMRHATDPDHVLAISTMVSRDPRLGRAVRMGLFWGVGHTMTVLGVGVLMLLCGVTVPPRAVRAMDLAVALMLIGLGVASLRARIAAPDATPSLAEGILVSPVRPLLVGIVHGLAGSASVTLLALTTIPDKAGALFYLGLFGVGTVAGMLVITGGFALSLTFSGNVSRSLPRLVTRLSGALSVTAGIVFAAQSLMVSRT